MSDRAYTGTGAGLEIRDIGLRGYGEVLELQKQLHGQRIMGQISDTALLVEHKPVITLGARDSANKLLVDESELAQKGVEIFRVRRGGGVTAHNPGQMVFYPIIDIKSHGLGINDYIRELEAIGMELLGTFGVESERQKGFPGLWTGGRKIASIGVRVSKGVTYHGMAINISNDLGIFDSMVPCGLDGVEVTSLLKETGKEIPMTEVKERLSELLRDHFCKKKKKENNGPARKLPEWLKRPLPSGGDFNQTQQVLSSLGLETICVNANCPNRGECWARHTATVLILGNICTRRCRFCSVATGKPQPPDATEPERVAQLAKQLELKYIVITSVDRDDLTDGGAGHFRDCIKQVRKACGNIGVEILTGDFRNCQDKALDILSDALPFVFGHNVETVPSLYPKARPGGDYELSLALLSKAKKRFTSTETKSSIMLGLGETDTEIEQVLKDLRAVGCDRITIGQYLRPSKDSLEVVEYITPERFEYWKQKSSQFGFSWVCSSPFARSSYMAEQKNLA